MAEQQAATPQQVARADLANQIASETPALTEAEGAVREDLNDQIVEENLASADTEESTTTELPTEQSAETPPQPEPVTGVDTQAAATPPASVEYPAIEIVRSAGPRQQFVQHIVLASRARANAWIATQTGVDRAIVVPINVNGTTRYAVVSGPFQDRAESRAYIQGMAQGADYWVRTAGSLQRILRDGE